MAVTENESRAIAAPAGDRARALASWAVLVLPPLAVLAFDLARRGRQIALFRASSYASYGLTALETALVWGSLLVVAARGRGLARWLAIVAFVALGAVALGSQRYFHQQYGTYLNTDAVLFGLSFRASLAHQLRADFPSIARAHVAPLALAIATVLAARAFLRPPEPIVRFARVAALPSLVFAALLPCSDRAAQASMPDVLYLHAMAGAAEVKLGIVKREPQVLPGERTPEFLPEMAAHPARRRNVLFVLTESVRADASCTAYDPGCKATPLQNAAAPKRIPLLQMRSNDSATAVSVAVLLTGVLPTSTREEMHRAPMLWEYARAGGWDTAYFTSQDLRFANSDMFVREVGARLKISGAELEPEDSDLDIGAKDPHLSAYALEKMATMQEPFVAVVQYSNTHFPYLVDEAKSPFQPSEFTKDPEKNTDFWNYYRNSIFLQDEAIGALVDGVRKSAYGERTVIVFTSDHGEAFREHWQIGHTLSAFDEEIHVPAWVDAPEGTLAPEEKESLVSLRDKAVFHTDVLPTLLDLVGVWDAPEIARFRGRLVGDSLLRKDRVQRPVPITNCAAVWGCPFKNWGMMLGSRKLEAREWDQTWHCWDPIADPKEQNDLGVAACGDLGDRAKALFGGLPKDVDDDHLPH